MLKTAETALARYNDERKHSVQQIEAVRAQMLSDIEGDYSPIEHVVSTCSECSQYKWDGRAHELAPPPKSRKIRSSQVAFTLCLLSLGQLMLARPHLTKHVSHG